MDGREGEDRKGGRGGGRSRDEEGRGGKGRQGNGKGKEWAPTFWVTPLSTDR